MEREDREMKKARNSERRPAKTGTQERDHDEGGAMSPPMRRLILSYVSADAERTWDPGVYARRPAAPA